MIFERKKKKEDTFEAKKDNIKVLFKPNIRQKKSQEQKKKKKTILRFLNKDKNKKITKLG